MSGIVYIGIDPGKTGAIAVITDGKLQVYDTPTVKIKSGNRNVTQFELPALWRILRKIKNAAGDNQLSAALEKVGPQPVFGAIPNFGLGNSYGHWEMALVAARIPFEYVLPTRWKHDMGIPPKSDKNVSRLRAQKLFARSRSLFVRAKDDGRAEAALIAEWIRRQRQT
jgi:crossover junction endodeoxyribonuclease RuvC